MSATTFYVDWGDLEATLTARAAQSVSAPKPAAPRRGPRLISNVDREISDLRANVQDSAKAVLTWLAAVAEPGAGRDLNDVLDRCLRPGPDVKSLNYTALAQEISQTIGVEISAKRVRTAIEHLRNRRAQDQAATSNSQRTLHKQFESLHARLGDNYQTLTDPTHADQGALRRSIAADVLAAVRCAAGRLIENDFGEGIPQCVDVDQLEHRFLDFVRDVMRDQPKVRDDGLSDDLHRLLVTLCDYDHSGESDMQVVMDGSRVVADLAGPGSLPGLLGQLNVLVAGRYLLESPVYCGHLLRLAQAAAALHDDPDTKTLLTWVRRLPEDQRMPSPLRVSSYCLNNAATHVLERLFTGELQGGEHLDNAKAWFDQMRSRDSGFILVKTVEIIYLTVIAKLTGDATPIEALFERLGRSESLDRLEALARYDNCQPLVQAAQHHAIAAIPELKHQLIRI